MHKWHKGFVNAPVCRYACRIVIPGPPILTANDLALSYGYQRLLESVTLSVALAGCSPEGAGSIKIENPQAVRDKVAGPPVYKKPATEKQARALEAEEEAAKKHPKLR